MAGEAEHSGPPAVLTLAPGTTAAELERLAQGAPPELRAAIAAHPNTPPALLEDLAATFPAQVLANPALPLLRLAHPRLLLDVPLHTLLRLLSQPDAPSWLLRHALIASAIEIQAAAAAHPALTAHQIDQMVGHPAWQVRARIAARPELPPALIARLAGDADYGVRMYIAARTDLPPVVAQQLAADPSVFVRQVLVRAQQSGLAAFVLGLCLLPWS
ncbi:variant leucine-rich repeat-containing protein [Deinococcus multiflagellatus]|uniref:variant leucine-rich repeat-containing protein n=1 Tax=Deinococcus multiflagellatus TaxID=1656887 RepID=UPI001CCE549F|nr:hypothetical protein [Deinococcus multiflagellatus]MBZ9712649.1 hypothetical protein [Deinococcus multiflagellatus]